MSLQRPMRLCDNKLKFDLLKEDTGWKNEKAAKPSLVVVKRLANFQRQFGEIFNRSRT